MLVWETLLSLWGPMYCLLPKSGCIWYVPVWGRFLKWETSTCRLSTWVYIYIYTYTYSSVIKKIKEPILIHDHGSLKNLKNWRTDPKKASVLCWFFHENHWFFEVFQITMISSSSLILQYLKNWNWQIFFSKNSRNCSTLGVYYVSSIWASFLAIFPKYFWGTKTLLY
jgi:hypothetical protein